MTLREDLYADISAYLVESCDIAPADITPEVNLFDGLGLDSLDLLTMAQILQEKYAVSLDDERIATVVTIDDILAFVEEKLAQRV